jgi:hypothetical protein
MALPLTAWFAIAASSTVVIGGIVKVFQWGYKVVRKNDTTQEFTVQMACNHLPHIYHVLELICHKLDIEVSEPPQIHFTDYKEKE